MVVPFSFAFRGDIHPGGEIMTKTNNPRVFLKRYYLINKLDKFVGLYHKLNMDAALYFAVDFC